MKLLTKLVRIPGYTYGYGDQYELTRDAAMAHAFTQALYEAPGYEPERAAEFIQHRVDELMTEWGLEED